MDIVSDEAAWAYPWFNHCIYASLLPPFSLILWYFVSTKAGEAENSLLCLALPVRSCGRRGRMAVHHLLEQCKVMCCRVDELTKGLFPPPPKRSISIDSVTSLSGEVKLWLLLSP